MTETVPVPHMPRHPPLGPAELLRRERVVKGWAFRDLTDVEVAAIRNYLDGGACPPGYVKLDAAVKPPRLPGRRTP